MLKRTQASVENFQALDESLFPEKFARLMRSTDNVRVNVVDEGLKRVKLNIEDILFKVEKFAPTEFGFGRATYTIPHEDKNNFPQTSSIALMTKASSKLERKQDVIHLA